MPPQAMEDIEALMSMRLADVHQIVQLVDYAYGGDYVDFEYILHNLGLPDLEEFGPVGEKIQKMVLARQKEDATPLASYDDEYDY